MGILLVYDVTDERSFNSARCSPVPADRADIRTWHANVEQHASEGVNKILVGNKCDWTDKKVRPVEAAPALTMQVISTEQGKELADELGIKFLETSAKANISVEDAFFTLARCVAQNHCAAACADWMRPV